MTNPSIFRKLLGDKVGDHDIQAYSDLKEVCYRDVARGKIQLMDGVRDVLDALTARGVKLAIGSSGVLPNLELTVNECGLAGRFAAIASLEDITHGKPDPEVFLVAAKKAGVRARRSVVFEDATVGIQAAKAAGMYAVGVTTTHPGGRHSRTPGPIRSSTTWSAMTSTGSSDQLRWRDVDHLVDADDDLVAQGAGRVRWPPRASNDALDQAVPGSARPCARPRALPRA